MSLRYVSFRYASAGSGDIRGTANSSPRSADHHPFVLGGRLIHCGNVITGGGDVVTSHREHPASAVKACRDREEVETAYVAL